MPRIWFSGPRMLGGLVRPGISFSTQELTRTSKRAPKIDPQAVLAIGRRPDGAILLQSPNHHGDEIQGTLVGGFQFLDQSEADEIRQGALSRLARHVGAEDWIAGASLGQVVSACRSEIAALGFTAVFGHITPHMNAITDAKIAAMKATGGEPTNHSSWLVWFTWIIAAAALLVIIRTI